MDDVTEAVQNPLASLNEGGRWRGASSPDGAPVEVGTKVKESPPKAVVPSAGALPPLRKGEVASRSDDGEVETLAQTQRIAAEGAAGAEHRASPVPRDEFAQAEGIAAAGGGALRRSDGEVGAFAPSRCVAESARNALRRSTPQEDLAERLAEEYLELRQFLPTVGEWSTLPTAVIREAAETGRSLLDAYLRHDYRERMRMETETAAQAAASAVSVGSLFSAPAAEPSAAERAMLQGVWNA